MWVAGRDLQYGFIQSLHFTNGIVWNPPVPELHPLVRVLNCDVDVIVVKSQWLQPGEWRPGGQLGGPW